MFVLNMQGWRRLQNAPDLFSILRGLIDKGRRKGSKTGRFLLLGSASIDLLRQPSESLAGRIAYRELFHLDITETGRNRQDTLWLRGGFPQSFLARGDARSLEWRRDFLRTYLSRDIRAREPRIPAETLRRLWTMLAHAQGTPLNESRLATSLSVSSPTVARYIDLLVDLLLVRRLPPFHANLSKRLVKSPKIYVRDSGVLHALLAIPTLDAFRDHPIIGPQGAIFTGRGCQAACTRVALPHAGRQPCGSDGARGARSPNRRRSVAVPRRVLPALSQMASARKPQRHERGMGGARPDQTVTAQQAAMAR